jgi:formamidopyrimidine-DNA glycosylase
MPELPEVETTLRGIEPWLMGAVIRALRVREPRLRWPVPARLGQHLRNARITGVTRRAKYLLIATETGTLIVHLGMSGSLRLLEKEQTPGPHEHVDLVLENGRILRYTDPRRFGAWLWTAGNPAAHALLKHIGPEPMSEAFDGSWLFERSRGRRLAVKSFLMDSHVVAGIGNIYANEALFLAGIHPQRQAGRISLPRYESLAAAIKHVLANAIRQGGTTLRDFTNGDGKPGYFQQSLQVYGNAGKPCLTCGTVIRETRTGQRSTFYCPRCQR